MSALIPGILIITTFLVASVIMFSTFLSISTTQSDSLKELGQVNRERASSLISISSAGVTGSSPGVSTDMTLQLENIGSRSVADFERMDVIIQYTDSSDSPVHRYLTYNPDGLGDNRWSIPVGGITPDTYNPGMWDPGETLTIDLRVTPDVKSGTQAVIAVATPAAASDQTTVGN
jgi:hypothetical protein